MMKATTNPNHASNRLSRGECATLPDAVAAVCEEVQAERDWHRREGNGIPRPLARELDDLEQRALTAKLLYCHGRGQPLSDSEIATLLRRVGLDDWADALDAADFRRFAL